jgi:tetratricopeptide (TPR) repeat protein
MPCPGYDQTMGSRAFGIVLMALVAWPAAAAEEWTRLSVPSLDLYTTAGPKQGKELLLRLEQVRAFFLKASPVRKISEVPLRIIEFRNRDEFQRFNPNQISAAYFANTPARDYIVLGPAAADDSAIAVHEYVHLIVKHSGLRLPVWLNEGWADVYSTLRPQGKETAVGDLLPARMQSLMKDQWMDFETLTSVTARSASYNEASRVGIFYAESWALAHMLYLAPEYQANFGKFVAALHAGQSADEACQAAWGRSGEQVFADLMSYFKRKKILGRVYDTRLENNHEEPRETELDEFDQAMLLADLLAVDRKPQEATAEFERLDREKPGRADVTWALGDLAMGRNDENTARTYYEKAFEAGEQDAGMCYVLALLEQKKGQTRKMLPVLERAVKSKPNYTEAEILLGLAKIDLRDFEGAIATLLAIDEIKPDDAPAVYCALTVSYVQTGDLDVAREHMATCRKWAKTDEQLKRAGQVTAFLDARSRPEAAVRKGEKRAGITGTAIGVDCATTGTRLRVRVNDKVASFDLPSPAAVEMTPAHGGLLKLQCGAIAPVRVGVEFAPPLTAIGNSAGIIRRLEY